MRQATNSTIEQITTEYHFGRFNERWSYLAIVLWSIVDAAVYILSLTTVETKFMRRQLARTYLHVYSAEKCRKVAKAINDVLGDTGP